MADWKFYGRREQVADLQVADLEGIALGTREFPGDGGQLNLLKSMKRQFAGGSRVRLA